MLFSLIKFAKVVNVFLSKIVPNGFDGFVMRRTFTLMLEFCAFSYADSRASIVSLKLLELSHTNGTRFSPVRHFKSRSNL